MTAVPPPPLSPAAHARLAALLSQIARRVARQAEASICSDSASSLPASDEPGPVIQARDEPEQADAIGPR